MEIINIIIMLVLLIVFIVLNKILNQKPMVIQQAPSPFDQVIMRTDGMEIINKFLNSVVKKYINQILIPFSEKTSNVIKVFLETNNNEQELTKRSVGFLMLVNSLMSRDLKNLFNRYYSVLDDNGEVNENFDQYVTEWFMLYIRYMNLKYMSSIGNDFSTEHAMKVNSSIFLELEMELYGDLNILYTKDEPKTKKQ